MDRRRFLRTSTGAAAGSLLFAHSACGPAEARSDGTAASDESAPDSREGVPDSGAAGTASDGAAPAAAWGVQLYTVRSLMADDVDRALELVADVGYAEVEFAGYFDRTPEQIRVTLDRLGLTAPATHVSIDILRDDFDATAAAARTVGHRYLVLPFLPQSERGDAEGYRRLAAEMNAFGARCRDAGLRFAYHNHDFELRETGGEIPLRILLEETDPGLVAFELDFYWLVNGGGEPHAYIDDYPGRFELCHVKDRTADGRMVDVGAGVIDFAGIFARSEEAGLIHYFVEHDRPDDPAASIAASHAHLAGLQESP